MVSLTKTTHFDDNGISGYTVVAFFQYPDGVNTREYRAEYFSTVSEQDAIENVTSMLYTVFTPANILIQALGG